MADGAVHDQFHRYMMLPTTIVFAAGTFRLTQSVEQTVYYSGLFYFGQQFNRLLTPDTDIDGYSYQDYLAGMIDPYFSWFWYLIWLIFGKIVPHRHFISHTPIFSALFRLLYLGIFIFPFVIYFWDYLLTQYFLCFVLGFIIGDCYHLILDYNKWTRWLVEKLFST